MKVDVNKLSDAIQAACPEIVFALLHGSAKDGQIKKGSDIDIALFITGKGGLEFYQRVYDAVGSVVPQAEPDIGILNNAEPVYRFEALKGKLIFNRDVEKYVSFFSMTCREYESQIADYQRQQKYRLESMKP